jgi:hypothetical protein
MISCGHTEGQSEAHLLVGRVLVLVRQVLEGFDFSPSWTEKGLARLQMGLSVFGRL